ncbi:MAG: hypothetical protein ABJC19_08905, partial [Gemmatimonadota bacterium]
MRTTSVEDHIMAQLRRTTHMLALRRVVCAVALSLLSVGTVAAQSTGKLEGRIRDQAGQPLANARVGIVGSTANATANPQGYYFI